MPPSFKELSRYSINPGLSSNPFNTVSKTGFDLGKKNSLNPSLSSNPYNTSTKIGFDLGKTCLRKCF